MEFKGKLLHALLAGVEHDRGLIRVLEAAEPVAATARRRAHLNFHDGTKLNVSNIALGKSTHEYSKSCSDIFPHVVWLKLPCSSIA